VIRVLFYVAIAAICVLGLCRRVRRPHGPVGQIAPLIITLAYGLTMLAWTAYHWTQGVPWQDPPVNVVLAAIGNGVILTWSLVGAFIAPTDRKDG